MSAGWSTDGLRTMSISVSRAAGDPLGLDHQISRQDRVGRATECGPANASRVAHWRVLTTFWLRGPRGLTTCLHTPLPMRTSDSAWAAARRFRRGALLVKCLAQSSRLRSLAVPFLEHSSRAD